VYEAVDVGEPAWAKGVKRAEEAKKAEGAEEALTLASVTSVKWLRQPKEDAKHTAFKSGDLNEHISGMVQKEAVKEW